MTRNANVIALLIAPLALSAAYGQNKDTEHKRRQYLEEIVRLQENPASADSFVTYHDKTWLEWQARTGELPPDFDVMASIPFLPDPLIMDEGGKHARITEPALWPDQRARLSRQVQHWISGTFPLRECPEMAIRDLSTCFRE